ncbi:MAG TPA: DUF5916 domain-containing protein [Candidatus Baltobacteraceae bacterium]
MIPCHVMLAALILAAVSMTTAVPAAAAPHPLPLDPSISDPAWTAGAIPAPGGFYDLTAQKTAPYKTSVWMEYDTQNLYVAFRAEQSGTPITAAQTTNDVGFGLDDMVCVGIDPSGAGTDAYIFCTTPRGVRYEQANETNRYRPQWSAAARVNGSSWSAVMAIPLKVMRIHAGANQTWRLNFFRNVAASAEHYTWVYNGAMSDAPSGAWPNFTDTRYWAGWTGVKVTSAMLASARPKPRAEFFALDSMGRDRNLFQQGNGTFLPEHVRVAGMDLTYPLTSTINFVGTLNPDFSNVEIDQQTIAPQEFRRNLQEYRPFFSQGASFVNVNPILFGPNVLFYSPGVGPFDRGEKVEGTFGDQSFGVLNFRGFDQTTGNTFDDTVYGFKHALPDRTFLVWADGVQAHHSIFGNDTSNEFGVAGRNLHTGVVWGVNRAMEHGSWDPLENSSNSYGFLDVHKHNYEAFVQYQDITPFYNPLDGFTTASDERGFSLFSWTSGASARLKNYTLFLNADRYLDRSGAVHQADFSSSLVVTFNNGFSLNGLGPNVGELRSYSIIDPASSGTTCSDPNLPRSYFTGFPGYYCGRNDTYNLMVVPIGYRDGTSTPTDASVSFGRFGYGLLGLADNGPDYVHLYSFSTSRPIARVLSLGFEYDGTVERGIASGLADSQWLRRVSVGAQLGPDENFTLSLRAINGTGGFAPPGVNLAAAYHRRFRNGDELFLNFGTPASPTTLDRFIAKYLFRLGGDAGT